MRRSAILLALLAFVLTALSSLPGAWACTCADDPLYIPLVTEHEEADLVFEGWVLGSTPWTNHETATTFDVEHVTKGSAPDPVRILHDGYSSCAKFFEPGERWLISADLSADGEYRTHACDRHEDWRLIPSI